MSKSIDLSKYFKPKSKERLKKELVIVLAIGLAWFIIIMLPWLFWLRPYKEFGHYEAEAVYNQNIFVVDTFKEKIIYVIDDVQYEKYIKYSRTYYVHNKTKLDFYYQLDNPYYTVNDRKSCLIAFPCVAAAGLVLCAWAVWYYTRLIKKTNTENKTD
ncbi:MAG: hypothetical protein K2O41_01270 [Clostridia bacterium]|nr:hypothetical protein [Clostridia bacterium]